MINKLNFKNINKLSYNDFVSDWVSQKDFYAYKKYTRNFYYENINCALRTGKADDELICDDIAALDRVFKTLPEEMRTKKPMTVYRGVRDYSFIEKVIKAGRDTFVDEAFVSTSKNEETAKRYAQENGLVLKINIPQDAKVIEDSKLPSSARSSIKGENEVLIPRNAKFRILSYSPKDNFVELEYLGQEMPLGMPNVKRSSSSIDILGNYNRNFIKECYDKVKDSNLESFDEN